MAAALGIKRSRTYRAMKQGMPADDVEAARAWLASEAAERAKARMLAAQNNDAGRAAVANLPPQETTGKARDIAAAAVDGITLLQSIAADVRAIRERIEARR